jgi:predicted transcriptional regulator
MVNQLLEQEILTALKTYEWTKTATVYEFARYIHYSEAYIRKKLDTLVDEGLVARIEEGKTHGKPRYIYQLTNAHQASA